MKHRTINYRKTRLDNQGVVFVVPHIVVVFVNRNENVDVDDRSTVIIASNNEAYSQLIKTLSLIQCNYYKPYVKQFQDARGNKAA